MLDPRDQLTPAELQQLAPGASLPHAATVRLAEVTAGVYGPDGELLGTHVATDPAEAMRVAIGRAQGLPSLGPEASSWLGRPRERALGVTLGILLGLALAWRLWR